MAEEEKVTPVAGEATSMADYEKELEASFKKIEEGDMITGTVIAVDEEEITLDLRYYTEGIIKVSDYSTHCPNRLLDGFSQEASSTRSAVLSMH